MKRNNRMLSAIACVALLLSLLPVMPATAAATVDLDFEGLSADSVWDLGDRFQKVDITEGSEVSRDIKANGDNEYLLMSIRNGAATTGTARNRIRTKETWSGTYTVEWDARNDTGVRFETYLRTGGNIRVRQMNHKLYLAVENPAAVAGSMTSVSSKVALQDGKWYTFKAEVSDQKIVLTFYDKGDNNTLLDTLTLKQDSSTLATLLDPYQIWFDMWGAAKDNTQVQTVAMDNIYITEGTYRGVRSAPHVGEDPGVVIAPSAGVAEEKMLLDFEKYNGEERFLDIEYFAGSDLVNGGLATRMIRDGGKGKYLQLLTANTKGTNGRIRNRLQTQLKFSGSFAVEWDYLNVGSTFARLDTYLRTGGNVRVSVFEDGYPHIRVLDAVMVPGVMESVMGTAPLQGDTWYTFKAQVTDDKLTVDIYNKQTGVLVESMTTGQDGTTSAALYDPYNIWFDMWGNADLANSAPAAVALDNIRVTAGAYDGLRNTGLAAAQVVAPEVSKENEGEYPYGYDGFGVAPHDNCPSADYLDVHVNAWYHDAVDYALTNKLMSGYNAYMFGTRDILTRAQVVQVLYNKEGQPALNGAKHEFNDVPADQWFNNAVAWGSAKKIVSGFGGGRFAPNDPVTLEQVAVILWNYSGTPAGNGSLDGIGNYSGWAANALKWAVEQGVLDLPYSDLTAAANRAQTAQILMNYLSK